MPAEPTTPMLSATPATKVARIFASSPEKSD